MGYNTLFSNTQGTNNVAVGNHALYSTTTALDNVAVGAVTLYSNTGARNTAVGKHALYLNTTGGSNTALGYQAGYTNDGQYGNLTGSNNTYLGYNSGPWRANASFNNSTAIGVYALVDDNNALVLGGTGFYSVNVGIGTATPSAVLDIQGGNRGGNAALIVNQTGANTNDIFAASASGVTKFRITNNGFASASAGFTINGVGNLQSTNAQTLTLGGSTTGNIVLSPLNSIAGGKVLPGADNLVSLGATQSSRFKDLFLGPGSLHVQCTVAGDSCGQNLDYAMGINTSTGDFEIGLNGNSGNRNALLKLTQGGTLVIPGTTKFGVSGPTFTWPGADGSNGYALLTNGNGTLSWGPASENHWDKLNGTLTPRLASTLDLLLGGDTTASAKFAVLNMNPGSGTPTASVSSGLSGTSMFMTADGTLATQNRMSLTIGNSSAYDTTGNVLINPNGTGNVGIGTTTPLAKLDVNGTASVAGAFTLYTTPTFQSTAKQTLTLGGDTTGGINFIPGNIQTLNLSSIGRIGMGTVTSPRGLLDISGNAGRNALFILNQTGTNANDYILLLHLQEYQSL